MHVLLGFTKENACTSQTYCVFPHKSFPGTLEARRFNRRLTASAGYATFHSSDSHTLEGSTASANSDTNPLTAFRTGAKPGERAK